MAIAQQFVVLAARLDAMSHFRHRPRTEDIAATIASATPSSQAIGVASTRLEHALPVTMSSAAMLAPEELYAPTRRAASDIVERDAGANRRTKKDAKRRKADRQPAALKPKQATTARAAKADALKQLKAGGGARVTIAADMRSTVDDSAVFESSSGSTALFQQLQREAQGEVQAAKRARIARDAATAAKPSQLAAQLKL